MSIPGHSPSRATFWLGLGLLLAAVAYMLPRIGRAPWVYDEGLILAGADRLLQGEIPYRDFWNTHPPGQIWVVAGLFRLFESSMLVLRLYDITIRACLALVLFGFASRLAPRAPALVAFAVATAWVEYYPNFGYTVYVALLLGLLSVGLLCRALGAPVAKDARWRVVVAGSVAGCGALFRLDFGLYVLVTSLVLVVLAQWSGREPSWAARMRAGGKTMALFAGGELLVLLPSALVLLAQGVNAGRLAGIVVGFPLTTYPEVRRLPLPPLSATTLIYFVPIWVCLAGLVFGVISLRRRKEAMSIGLAWCALALLPLVATPHTRTRADLIHQAPLLFSAAPLSCALWYRLWQKKGPLRTGALLVVPLLLLTFLFIPARDRAAALLRPASASAGHGLERGWGITLQPDMVATVRAIQRRTAPGDWIYVGAGRHDRLYGNDALFYFLAGRRYATTYHNLLPGLVTQAGAQREIVADLVRHDTRWIVLCTLYDAIAEPNQSGRATGSHVLDDFIRQRYVIAEKIGDYEVWTRR